MDERTVKVEVTYNPDLTQIGNVIDVEYQAAKRMVRTGRGKFVDDTQLPEEPPSGPVVPDPVDATAGEDAGDGKADPKKAAPKKAAASSTGS